MCDSTGEPALLNVLVAGLSRGRTGGAAAEGGHQQRVSVPDAGRGDRLHAESARHRGGGARPGAIATRSNASATASSNMRSSKRRCWTSPASRSGSSASCARLKAPSERIASLYTNIILLWLLRDRGGLGPDLPAGAARSWSRVKHLDRAAAEVARQNYAIEVEVTERGRNGPAGADVQHHVRVHPRRRART